MEASNDEILEKIALVIINSTDIAADDIDLDQHLNDLSPDEEKRRQIIRQSGNTFGVVNPDGALKSCVTIRDLVDYIQKNQA